MISFEPMHPLEQPSSPLTFDVGMCTSVLLLKQYPSGNDAGPSDKSQIKMKQNCLIKSLQCAGMQGKNCRVQVMGNSVCYLKTYVINE